MLKAVFFIWLMCASQTMVPGVNVRGLLCGRGAQAVRGRLAASRRVPVACLPFTMPSSAPANACTLIAAMQRAAWAH